MSEPIVTATERLTDTTNLLHMSDDTFLYGCKWPSCQFTSTNKDSIPSHYKHHVGQAAQRRRAQQRPRSAVVSNEVLEAALALLDMTQELIDKLASFDDEFTEQRRQINDYKIEVEGLRQQVEINREKAERFDRLSALMRNVDDGVA
jgi:hypothetical protein